VNRFLLDTSAVIAIGRGELDSLSGRTEAATISVLTICGLHHGVLAATRDQRPGRLALLTWAERTFSPLPIDARIAPAYGRLAVAARAAKRDVRRGTDDLGVPSGSTIESLVTVVMSVSPSVLDRSRVRRILRTRSPCAGT
jgi:predicted nucleic acid-binding protein